MTKRLPNETIEGVELKSSMSKRKSFEKNRPKQIHPIDIKPNLAIFFLLILLLSTKTTLFVFSNN